MKPETRQALRAGRDFQPGFYARMSEEELAEQQKRDNGLIARGPVVAARYVIDGLPGVDPLELGVEDASLDMPSVGQAIDSALPSLRVASWRHQVAGLNPDGVEVFERVIVLTRDADAELVTIDTEHVARMAQFDEDMGVLIEAGLTAADEDALKEMGAANG